MTLDKTLLNLFFPPRCPFCGTIQEEEGICPQCQETLPWIGEQRLPAQGEFFEGCYAPLWYKGRVRESFHRYKFGGRRRYDKIYGMLMAQSVEDCLEYPPDYITWAPISRTRRRRRGYDQSEQLAKALAQHLGIPLLPTLDKWRNTPPQSSLEGTAEKKANAMGAYRMISGVQVTGRRLLLVDDIITTGSTLSECARILRTAGAESVVCVSLARADKKA